MPNQLARGGLLQQPKILVVLHAITQILPPNGIDGSIETRRLVNGRVASRGIKEAPVAIAPVANLAGFLAVAGLVAHGVGPRVLEFGWRERRRAVPIECRPDQDTLHAVLPGLPRPKAQFGAWVIDKLGDVGRLGAATDIPPYLFTRCPLLAHQLRCRSEEHTSEL